MTERELLERLLRAALRETPGPYRMMLAEREWERIKAELRETEIEKIARYHGQEV